MAVSLWVEAHEYVIGTPEFSNGFFSTVLVNLEGGVWGTLFPVTMREFHSGRLMAARIPAAHLELKRISEELGKLSPAAVVWDFEDRAKSPPWGDKIAPTVTSLANYFWTADGRPLLVVIETAFIEGQRTQADVTIR